MNVTYGGGGSRFVAALLDGLIITVIQILAGFVIGLTIGAISGTSSLNAAIGGGAVSYMLGFIWSIGYYVVYQQLAGGQTLGKKALGLKVIDAQGKTPSMLTFFLREVIGKMVSAIILMIGYLMILWDGRKQGLHDKIAGTYVIKVQPEQAVQPQQPIVQQPV